MTERRWVWARVDQQIPWRREGLDVERLTVARLVIAMAAFGAAANIVAPLLTAATDDVSLLPAAAGLISFTALVLARVESLLSVARATLIASIFFLAVVSPLALDTDGDPAMGFGVLIGLAPLIFARVAVSFALTLALLAAVAAAAPPPLEEPEMVPMVVGVGITTAAWFMLVAGIDSHRLAVSALRAHQRAAEADRASLEEETQRMVARADETTHFIRTMSHELRTPLNGVLGVAGLFESEALGADARHALAELQREGRAVQRAFDTLLALTRREAGADQAEHAPTDVPGLLDRVASEVGGVTAPGPAPRLNLDAELPRVLTLDARALRAVATALLHAVADLGGCSATLSASFDGEALALVFGSACEAPTTCEATPSGQNLGPGLALARELAAYVGGSTTVTKGEDAHQLTVSLRLPARRPGERESTDR